MITAGGGRLTFLAVEQRASGRCIWLVRRPLAKLEQGLEIVGPTGPPTAINIRSAQAPRFPLSPLGSPGGCQDGVLPARERPLGALASLFRWPNVFYLNANFDFSLGS